MKAIQLEQPKAFREIDIPEPERPGPGDAVVKVSRVGVCGTDYSGYLGKMPFFSYPRIPGHELGVEVVAVGEGVTSVKVGDKAAVEPYINCQRCYSCARGHTNCCENHLTLGVHIDGGLRPLFTVPARKLHVSTKLSFEQLALVETLGIGLHAMSGIDMWCVLGLAMVLAPVAGRFPKAVGALVLIGVGELFVGFRRELPALRWSALACFGLLVVRLYAGRLLTNTFPYCFFKIRLSSNASTPRSLSERIRRPNPCLSASTASGIWYSVNAFRPSSCSARTRAATTGSLGTANGSRSTITQESCSPGTSTPSQKLCDAKSTDGWARKVSSNARRGASPCFSATTSRWGRS